MASLEGHSLVSLALKMEEGAVSQGKRAASKSWKRQKIGLSPGSLQEKCSPSDTLILAQ